MVALASSLEVEAQSDNRNYISEKIYLDEQGTNKIAHLDYYDGLGNLIETISTGSGSGKSIYSFMTYDSKEREDRSYLPVPQEHSLSFMEPEELQAASSSFYDNDNTAYRQKHYDAMDRIIAEDMPGLLWRKNHKAIAYRYSTNTVADKVLHYDAPLGSMSLALSKATRFACYPEATLTKVVCSDADGKTVTYFEDIHGNIILERRDMGDTYFVYNDLGQLRFVLTPKYQTSENKELFAYEYRYDWRGRLVKKILPGCGYMQYWYDRDGRVMFFQDENLRTKGKYRYWLYDLDGRNVIQGLCDDCKRDDSMLPIMSTDFGKPGLLGTGYELRLEGLFKNPTIEQVVYYDDYRFLNGSMKDKFAGMEVGGSNAKGFITGVISRASNGEFLYETRAYDLKGNIIETKTKELKDRLIHTRNVYTFTNNLKESSSEVNVGYGQPFLATTTYTFNKHNDKPETCITTVSHSEEQQMSSISYTYDDFGQLKSVSRPFGSGQSGNVNYKYDLHGWVKQITTNSFKESMFYADGPGTPCYNGNISSLTWENAGYRQKRGYKFTYDRLNRMTNAVYGERDDLSDKAGHYNETLEYDTNGNIMRLQRRGLKQDGQHGNIDDLHLSYNGNQPIAIKEDAEPILYEGAFGLNEKGEHRLAYNGDGALQSDETRGIAMIEYDAGNNPQRIQFTNGNVTKYVYTPDGQKLRTIHHTAMPNIKVEVGQVHPLTAGEILSSDSLDYMMGGKLITKNGRIDKYLFEGGYCRATGTRNKIMPPPFLRNNSGEGVSSDSAISAKWKELRKWWEINKEAKRKKDFFWFYYYNKDHLGNIREVVSERGTVIQTTNYYPFGTPYCDAVSSKSPSMQPYKYNGKELDLMHGLNTYDYGARQYNPVVPIWDRVDPLCEKYYNTSPYAYCGNNPVNRVDPNGCWHWDKNSNLHADKNDNTKTMADFLGTSQKDVLQILNRNKIGVHKGNFLVNDLSKLAIDKSELYVMKADREGAVLELPLPHHSYNTLFAVLWYYLGGGKPADVGEIPTMELLNSQKFKDNVEATTTQDRTSNEFPINLTLKTFHIGRTNVKYTVYPGKKSSHVTFTIFDNDRFADPLDIGIEVGGTPYDYKTRTVTYYFKPINK